MFEGGQTKCDDSQTDIQKYIYRLWKHSCVPMILTTTIQTNAMRTATDYSDHKKVPGLKYFTFNGIILSGIDQGKVLQFHL